MKWVVISYERVDVRTMEDPNMAYIPGEVKHLANIVDAETEDQAIEALGVPGFFNAFPLPRCDGPREAHIEIEAAQ